MDAVSPSLPQVEVEGYSFPKRIPGQPWIEQHLPRMEQEEAEVFLSLLVDRRWTEDELEQRIYSVRPGLRPEEE